VAGSTPFPAASERAGHRHRKWGWLLGLATVGLAGTAVMARGSAGQPASGHAAARAGASAIPILAATAVTGDVGVYLTGLGAATAINTVTVRTRVDGQLNAVAFREGQLVHKGDLLAQIDPRPFQVQLVQAEGQKAKDEAALKDAQLDLQRYQVLVQQDSAPRQQLDAQVATVHQLEAALKTDQGQVEAANLNLVYSRITAPISGVVGLRLVDPGNIVHATDTSGLVVITQLQPMAVVFTLPADQLPRVVPQVRAGRPLVVEAYDRDLENRLATGSVLAVDNQIDQSTGTFRLKGVFPNQDNSLFPNQFVNARLRVDTLRATVMIPSAAIQRSPQATFVYVVKPDQTVELRDVDVQLTEGDQTSVRRGISPGEVVVIDGTDKLAPGTKVAVTMGGAKNQNRAQAGP
jgi:membrane fusion protein, multidrug efflux system